MPIDRKEYPYLVEDPHCGGVAFYTKTIPTPDEQGNVKFIWNDTVLPNGERPEKVSNIYCGSCGALLSRGPVELDEKIWGEALS